MKVLLALVLTICIGAALLSATKKSETATITSVTHTQAGDVVCWNYTADDNVDCVTIEVKSKETNDQFRTTLSTGSNCLSNSSSASGCNTFAYKGAKGRTYRLRVIRNDWTSYYSNEVSL